MNARMAHLGEGLVGPPPGQSRATLRVILGFGHRIGPEPSLEVVGGLTAHHLRISVPDKKARIRLYTDFKASFARTRRSSTTRDA